MVEDLADRLDDLICSFEGAVGGSLPDLATLLLAALAWAVVGAVVVGVASILLGGRAEEEAGAGAGATTSEHELARRSEEIISNKIAELKKESASLAASAAPPAAPVVKNGGTVARNTATSASANANPAGANASATPRTVVPKVEVVESSPVKTASAAPRATTTAIPSSLGSDEEAVAWVNGCLAALWRSAPARAAVAARWRDALAEYARASAQEVGTRKIQIYSPCWGGETNKK